MAEKRAAVLITCIQPNQPSEGRRNAVSDYVQRLIVKCFACQVVDYRFNIQLFAVLLLKKICFVFSYHYVLLAAMLLLFCALLGNGINIGMVEGNIYGFVYVLHACIIRGPRFQCLPPCMISNRMMNLQFQMCSLSFS